MIKTGTPCLETTSFKYCLVNFSIESVSFIVTKSSNVLSLPYWDHGLNQQTGWLHVVEENRRLHEDLKLR
ncbi:hypothetical protein Tco_0764269 [Tanacetum coccineum]